MSVLRIPKAGLYRMCYQYAAAASPAYDDISARHHAYLLNEGSREFCRDAAALRSHWVFRTRSLSLGKASAQPRILGTAFGWFVWSTVASPPKA